jgi:hypothetical protein
MQSGEFNCLQVRTMPIWMKLLLWIITLSVLCIGILLLFGVTNNKNKSAQQVNRLIQLTSTEGHTKVDFSKFEQLPPPVVRYFQLVLRDGQPLIRIARFSQKGELRTNEKSDKWSPFEANQIVVPAAPGFQWNARISIAPLLHVQVCDTYIAGKGSGRVSLMSAITLAHDEDIRELNSGALHRYIAEAVWYPTALLPDAGVKWSEVDDNTAIATLTDSGTTISLEFRFNHAGEVTGIYTPERYGRFDGEYELHPWEGHFRNYEERNGIMVPMEGEVGWHLPDGWWSFWKGNIIQINYDFMQ